MALGEMTVIEARLTGEMKPEDIPAAPGVDVEALKAGDNDPMEVVVEVPAGKSERGWNYKPESLQAIVDYVNANTLPGILGHQKAEDVAHKFEEPVTHWVGARMDGTKAYFRGVIDQAATNLKRWIRTKRINQVSIFGYPKLKTVAGETVVFDYRPLSIDWTPLGRAGMASRIVVVGEMEENQKGGDVLDWKELIAQLKALIEEGTVSTQEVVAAVDQESAKKTADLAALLEKVKEALAVEEDDKLLDAVEEAKRAVEDSRKAARESLVKEAVREKVTGDMAQGIVERMLVVPEGATKEIIAGEIDSLLADSKIKDVISRLHTDAPAFTSTGETVTPGAGKIKRVAI